MVCSITHIPDEHRSNPGQALAIVNKPVVLPSPRNTGIEFFSKTGYVHYLKHSCGFHYS